MLDTLTPIPEAPRTIEMRDEHDLAPGAGAALLHAGYRIVGAAADVPLLEGRRAIVDGRAVSVYRLRHGFAAIEGSCPHPHSPGYAGLVADRRAVCPVHGWQVDLDSGEPTTGHDHAVAVHQVAERDGLLYVRLAG
ncbi:Rieske (2Fe-2S) protein [Patulibacter defluvii]|uniref:Rieske (2Fe-2S) protein n=1 Tax=Patulibacter defluvii TaxID=3095358 RepID=UPI002A759B38|nr:Rieske 2Fe-2S domain-containing protein [Patulibacter sp. DM4]